MPVRRRKAEQEERAEIRSAGRPTRQALSGAVPRLHARAYDILVGRIAQGSLPPGTKLLESRIADEFGISRAPARQALAALEAEGLVVRSEGHGYAVVGPAAGPRPATSSAPPQPVRLTPTASWERIYAEVESDIVARTAFASWRLVEADLAKSYSVSRTVAREVIARLQQRGIIKKDDKSRWYAPALTPRYVAELYELRWVLEPVALVNAIPSVPPELVPRMRRHLEEAIAHAETLDGAALDDLEAEMHVELLGHCGNRTMMEAIGRYQSLLVAHSFLYNWAPRLYPTEPFLPEHMRIVERLESGHVQGAAEALEDHLRASLERAVSRIEVVAREFNPEPLPYLDLIRPATEDMKS